MGTIYDSYSRSEKKKIYRESSRAYAMQFISMEYPYPLCGSQRIRRGHGCFANTWQEIKDVFEGGEEWQCDSPLAEMLSVCKSSTAGFRQGRIFALPLNYYVPVFFCLINSLHTTYKYIYIYIYIYMCVCVCFLFSTSNEYSKVYFLLCT